MKDFLNSHLLIDLIASLISAFSVFISFEFFKGKKEADKKLSILIQKEQGQLLLQLAELEQMRTEIKKKAEAKKNEELTTVRDFEEDYYKMTDELLNKEMELMKYNLLKNNLEHLASKLNNKDRDEILNALKQASLAGQINYINHLLKLSGSTQSTLIKVGTSNIS